MRGPQPIMRHDNAFIERMRRDIRRAKERVMSAIDDLNAAVDGFTNTVSNVATTMQAELDAIAAANQSSGANDPAIEAAVSKLTAMKTTLDNAVASAQNVLTPPAAGASAAPAAPSA